MGTSFVNSRFALLIETFRRNYFASLRLLRRRESTERKFPYRFPYRGKSLQLSRAARRRVHRGFAKHGEPRVAVFAMSSKRFSPSPWLSPLDRPPHPSTVVDFSDSAIATSRRRTTDSKPAYSLEGGIEKVLRATSEKHENASDRKLPET